MRNVNVDGRALAPIEFFATKGADHKWSEMYPVYEERMKAMSVYIALLMRGWLD